MSRKRLRPLDPGEERALHTTDPLLVTLLDDERSYCFSWPGAALTAWINTNLDYTETYIYKSASAAAAAASTTSGIINGGLSGGSGGGAAGAAAYRDDGSAVSRVPIVTPPVFSVLELLSRGFGPPLRSCSDDGNTREGNEEDPEEDEAIWRNRDWAAGQGRPPASSGVAGLGTPTEAAPSPVFAGAGVNSLSVCEDLTDLLAPFVHRNGSDHRHLHNGHPPSTIVMSPGTTPRAAAHPLSPPRPLCTGEDSIFSLNEGQLRDAATLGLLTPTTMSALTEKTKHDTRTTLHDAFGARVAPKVAFDDGNGEEVKGVSLSGGELFHVNRGLRRRLEYEVVGLEWRAYKESQRTASALQRLLSLEAAVPFDPATGGAPATITSPLSPLMPAVSEDWRRKVYRLWLCWRVGESAGVTGSSVGRRDASEGAPHSTARDAASPLSSSPTSAYPFYPDCRATSTAVPGTLPTQQHQQQQQQHPWGAPLVPGAYLYDSQPDYFLNPARIVAMAATEGGGGISNTRGGRDLSAASSLSANSRRRRGPYSFLSWKIELYLPQLQQFLTEAKGEEEGGRAAGSGRGQQRGEKKRGRPAHATPLPEDGVENGDGAPQLTLEHPAYAAVPTRRQRQLQLLRQRDEAEDAFLNCGSSNNGRRSGGEGDSGTGGSALLNSQSVDALVKKVILSHPLVELERGGETGEERLRALGWTDLQRDTERWRTWLSKV